MRNTMMLLAFMALTGCVFLSKIPVSEQPKDWIIHHGMTKEQVKERWGEPLRVIKKDEKEYNEIWVYKFHWKTRSDLYFKNGILVRGLNEDRIVQ
jgi:hypothetical protein